MLAPRQPHALQSRPGQDTLLRPRQSAIQERELRIFEAVAGAELERYGYARSLRDPRISVWEVASCRYLEHPPQRALAMLRNRQGYRFTIQRLRLNVRIRLGL